MQIIDPALGQVVEVALYTLQIPGKCIYVHDLAEHLISFVPVWDGIPDAVPGLELGRALRVEVVEHGAEVIEGLAVSVVQLEIEPFQFVVVILQPVFEGGLPFLVDHASLSFFLYVASYFIQL